MKSKAERARDIERAFEKLEEHAGRIVGLKRTAEGLYETNWLACHVRIVIIDAQLWMTIDVERLNETPVAIGEVESSKRWFLGVDAHAFMLLDGARPVRIVAPLERDPIPEAFRSPKGVTG